MKGSPVPLHAVAMPALVSIAGVLAGILTIP